MAKVLVHGEGRAVSSRRAVDILLSCGILSSVLYVVGDLFASTRWDGYSYANQAVSELNQKTVDLKLILYILGIILIGVIAWWLITRRTRTAPPPEGA